MQSRPPLFLHVPVKHFFCLGKTSLQIVCWYFSCSRQFHVCSSPKPVQVRRALSYAPRSNRAMWSLDVTVARLQSLECRTKCMQAAPHLGWSRGSKPYFFSAKNDRGQPSTDTPSSLALQIGASPVLNGLGTRQEIKSDTHVSGASDWKSG